jgi:hypothetical protein
LLARVGLAGFEDKFPWELSGGMQQRASICRALIHQPRLLMLDEPFGALDAFTREELWCMLRDLWQQQPFTVILVTHDLREAVFLADTVYVMSKRPGRILVRREIDLPRPRPGRDLHRRLRRLCARTARAHRPRARVLKGQSMKPNLVKAAPWLVVPACSCCGADLRRLRRARVPAARTQRGVEGGRLQFEPIMMHATQTFLTTLAGFRHRRGGGAADRHGGGLLAAALPGHVPAAGGLQLHPQGGLRAGAGGVVRHRHRAGHPHRLPDLLLPGGGQRGHRPGHPGAGAGGRAALLGASRIDILGKVGLPRAMPYFFASLKVAITLAFVGSVIAETVASNLGIGYLMMSASSSMNMPLVSPA